MKKILLAVLLSVPLALCSATTFAQTILVIGDSLSSAYNMGEEQGWVNLLQDKLDKKYPESRYQVVNSSTSGDTTAGGLSRLPAMLEQHSPDVVIVELGANDGLRGLSLKQMKRNLEKMIELSMDKNAEVILAGMLLPPNYGELFNKKFHQVYLDLGDEQDITLIPFFLENVGGVAKYIQADGMHPNSDAQPLILDNVWPHLELLLEE
ncbi:arylesterase [Porticoccaceae bacterium LTM1]|nr:arylesterase [Porticoccaceae bacterium LTM1]